MHYPFSLFRFKICQNLSWFLSQKIQNSWIFKPSPCLRFFYPCAINIELVMNRLGTFEMRQFNQILIWNYSFLWREKNQVCIVFRLFSSSNQYFRLLPVSPPSCELKDSLALTLHRLQNQHTPIKSFIHVSSKDSILSLPGSMAGFPQALPGQPEAKLRVFPSNSRPPAPGPLSPNSSLARQGRPIFKSSLPCRPCPAQLPESGRQSHAFTTSQPHW